VREATPGADVLMVDGFTSDGLPARLSSQRFYDDCAEMLQPTACWSSTCTPGTATTRPGWSASAAAFDGAVLVVDGRRAEQQHRLRLQGRALDRATPGAVRRPKRAGTGRRRQQLVGAFARVSRR
jgi:spermidine synthase